VTATSRYRLPRLDWPFGLVFLLTLAVCVFYTLAYTSLVPYSGLTLDETWDLIVIDPCDSAAEWCRANRESLRLGDRLLSIGDLTYDDYRRDRRLVPFAGYHAGDVVPMTVSRGGAVLEFRWHMPPSRADLFQQASSVYIYLPFLIAGAVVWLFLRPRDRRWQLLILFNCVTAMWLAVGSQTALHVAAASLVSRAVTWLLVPVYFHLHLVVPAPLRRRPHRVFLPVLYAAAALLAALELGQFIPGPVFQLGLLAAIAASLGLLAFRLLDKPSPTEQLAVRLMFTGIGLAFAPGVFLWLIPTMLRLSNPGSWVTIVTLAALPALPAFYIYALYKRHLGALEFRANRLLSLYSFILLYATLYLTAFWLLSRWNSSDVFLLLLSLAFILAAPAVNARIQQAVNRLAYGAHYKPDDIMQVFASRIPTATDRGALVRLLADEVAPALLVRQSALYLVNGNEAQLIYARGVEADESREAARAVRQLLTEAGRYRPDGAAASEGGQDPGSQPAFDWVQLVIPLETQQKPVGVWLFGRRDPDDFYPLGDVLLLRTLANQAALAVENARLFEDASRRLERLQVLRHIDLTLTASLDLRVTLNALLEQITSRLRVDAADILLLNRRTQMLGFAAGRGFRTRALQHTQLRLGESHAGLAALERRVIHISDLRQSAGDLSRAPLLSAEGFVVYYGAPLITKGQVAGVLEIFHRSLLSSNPEWMEFLDSLAGQAAIAIDNAAMFEDVQRSNLELSLAYDTTLEGWSHALELRDQETQGHTERVTEMTLQLARAMGAFTEEALTHVRRGVLLHDIGKMAVPDGILLKPGPLTDEEWAVMRKHPTHAYEMLSPIAFLRPALDIPYCHHEKWDGTGYPRGLRGEEIPLAARIFAAVDVWDALTSDRPYRSAWPPEKVRQHIRALAGTHFDPQVVEVFLRAVAP
jgi:HD-GYP domain-containing protein (c-di-GMP phosphodiesterase class II)